MGHQRSLLLPIAAVLSVFLASCAIFPWASEPEDFIRVRGTTLIHQGMPYRFAGANMWYGGYLGSPGQSGDRPRLLRELDSLSACGLTNLRVLAASERSGVHRAVTPAIQEAPGVFNDSLLQGLDFLLAEMARRHMHAVLYLGNYWEWSGGFSQYNTWTGGPTVDPEDPAQGWPAFMDHSASFYDNERAMTMFRATVRTIVTRRNSVNGRLYAEDPTIMSWQLANEPRPGRDGAAGEKNLPSFYHWLERTARYIHDLDTNHLVSSGSEGTMGTLRSEEYYRTAYSTPSIDYLTMHLWPQNWGWFDPTAWEATLPSAMRQADAYIATHIALARELKKPLVMDEFGLGRDGGTHRRETPTQARDRYFTHICRLLEDSVRAGAPLSGANVWAWGGEGHAVHPDGMWRAGDPFVGDPPQEPQGMNSIFSTDASTIAILRHHADSMAVIGAIRDTVNALTGRPRR